MDEGIAHPRCVKSESELRCNPLFSFVHCAHIPLHKTFSGFQQKCQNSSRMAFHWKLPELVNCKGGEGDTECLKVGSVENPNHLQLTF